MTDDASNLLPRIDLEAFERGPSARAALLAQVDSCLRTAGFLVVVGHGVDPTITDRSRALAMDLFRLPLADKRDLARDDNRGWVGAWSEQHHQGDRSHGPDMKEVYKFGPDAVPGAVDERGNRWPAAPDGFVAACHAHVRAMEGAAERLLVVLAGALGADLDFFTSRASRRGGQLNINWYPSLRELGPDAAGHFRIGPHTDFGGLTLLDRRAGPAGLQIQTLDGDWIDAPDVPGSIVVNVGDLVAAWTGGRWRSTPHRVLPPDPRFPDDELLSLAYFQAFDHEVVVEALAPPLGGGATFGPVTAGDYVATRIRDLATG